MHLLTLRPGDYPSSLELVEVLVDDLLIEPPHNRPS
jgi:hypothetical protein